MNKTEIFVKKMGAEKCLLNAPLAIHTYMKVGGPADILVLSTNTETLTTAVTIAQSLQLPYTVLGNGANVLVADKGIRGVVILNKSKNYRFLDGGRVEVDSGVSVTELITEATKRNLSGFERMMKVPATVGGAIFMNAGDTGKKEFFGDLVESVKVLTPQGQIQTLSKEDCEFTYRTSRFQSSGEIILQAVLQLKEVSKSEIEEKVKDILVRKTQQPAGPSVGSTFRNPPGGFAGQLLEKAGVKGLQVGGAKVSERHANFIINLGNSRAENIRDLITQMKRKVRETSGVHLEEEVRYVGEWQ